MHHFIIEKIINRLFVIIFVLGYSCADSKTDKVSSINNIIPEPVLIQSEKGNFTFTSEVRIIHRDEHENIIKIANILSEGIKSITGLNLNVGTSLAKGDKSIYLEILNEYNDSIGREGYILDIKQSGINIYANSPAGIFYGVQSLLQIVPICDFDETNIAKIALPCAHIMDYPRFKWRGLLFDAAHWWYEIEDVRKFIDQMAKYKYNTLTLHLTNDNAWRIEIKAYPKLNEIGSWRVPRTGRWNTFYPPQLGEKATYGGYYTQEELKELVKYAQERNVTIVPKIELPGHMLALIASYPSTSCTGLQYDVNAGWPRKYGEIPYEMCAGKETNFEMLDNILDEYVEVFPSEYIHIGGDEVNYSFWETCPNCQKRMADENLQNVQELQSYFIKRISEMLNRKGRKLIGWDEILEGGLAPDATVMSWRGIEGGIKAAQMHHDVVMAPNTFTYFDYRQTDRNIIPETYCWGYLPISTTYKWEPVPDNVAPQYILGGQGQLWSEFMPHLRQIEYMTWPRALALSEVLWSPKSERNTDEFIARVEAHFTRLEMDGIKYAKSIYDPIITLAKGADGIMQLTLSSETKNLDIFYTFDGTVPDNFSPKYQDKPLDIPKGATHFQAVTYRDGVRMGKWLSISVGELQKRL